jgi:Flp pilus assembly protein TadB
VEGISGSADGDMVSLPDSTSSGIRLNWKMPGNFSLPALIVILLLIGFAVYKSRYALVDKAVERWREGVRRDFPGFLSKLLLLLNAGLVITSAITRIADDYSVHRKEGEERYFYEELCGMRDRMRASNTTLTVEFADMAARSGQREVMRFSTILADNIDRGNALAEKLSQESRTLWTARKKIAEEKGRLAETKLTFPMVLQLLVIILITVTPAVMNMR